MAIANRKGTKKEKDLGNNGGSTNTKSTPLVNKKINTKKDKTKPTPKPTKRYRNMEIE
jgi:hypothetical protein